MKNFKPGDRVYVTDEGLAALRRIMREATGKEPEPNHWGRVDEVRDGEVLVTFDDGGCAPYPLYEVERLGLPGTSLGTTERPFA